MYRWILFGTALFISWSALWTPLAADEPLRPNIIFILADDLGYGDLGCYGQRVLRTPHLDRMAREGMRFTQFYAGCTVCAPSRCVLMTGLHMGHCYIRGNAKVNLRPQDVTVAEVLRGAGYRTGLVGKWGLGHEGSTGVPTRQGFGYFFGYLDQHHAHNYYPTFLLRNETRVRLPNVVPNEDRYGGGVATVRRVYSGQLLIEEALRFIDQHKDEPFFLYFAPTLPHANNEARSRGMEVPDYGPWADRRWPEPEKGFAAMVSMLDAQVGQILDRLRRHGIAQRTLVIFSSDNGPHQEGGHKADFFDSNGPLRGIKRDLYEGGIRVPTIAWWPGTVPSGTISEHIAYFGDFLATAAELAGVECPPGRDSISFLPTLLGKPQEQKQHRYLYWEFYERGGAQAVRQGRWKLVRKPWNSQARVELYDLQTDLGEQHNVAAQHPQVVQRLLGYIQEAHRPDPQWKVRGRPRRGKRPVRGGSSGKGAGRP